MARAITTRESATFIPSPSPTRTPGAFTLAGGNLTLGAGGIENNSNSTQTVALNIGLGADQSFAANPANLVVSGTVSGNYALMKVRQPDAHPHRQQHLHRRHDDLRRALALGGNEGFVSGNITVGEGATFAIARTIS
jgi:hypothetical protein